MTGENNLYTLSREMAGMTINRVDNYEELYADTAAEGEHKFAEATAKHINRVSLQPATPEGKQAIRPASQLDGECAEYLLKKAGIEQARLEYPKKGKFPASSFNVLESGNESFLYDAPSDTAFYRPGSSVSSASEIVYKTVTALGLLDPSDELELLVTYVSGFTPADSPQISVSFDDLMNRLNNTEEPVTLDEIQPDPEVSEAVTPEDPLSEAPHPEPVTIATVEVTPIEKPTAPKREKPSNHERFGNPNQALDVLFRIAGRYSDLYQQAEATQIEVRVENDLGNTRRATELAWNAVREMNIKAAPRYLGNARERINQMDGKPWFTEIMNQVKPLIENAGNIYDVRREISRLKKELDQACAAPDTDIMALEKTRSELEKREEKFLRHGLPEVISLSRQAWSMCEREIRNPETRKQIQAALVEEQRSRRVQRSTPPVGYRPKRSRVI